MILKKPLVIATLAATVALGTLSTKANAGDPVLGALIGGGIGAAIGHDINRHNGGAVGGVLGAIVGSSIAADSGRYYDRGYYDRGYYAPRAYYEPAPVYYEPAPVYYSPAPVYYGSPGVSIVYSSGPSYRGHRYYDRRDHRDHRYWR